MTYYRREYFEEMKTLAGMPMYSYGSRRVPITDNPQYDALVETFMKHDRAANRISRKLLHEQLSDADIVGKRVLDLGCGYGHDAQLIAGRGGTVAGVDESLRSLEIARVECPQGEFVQADFSCLPFKTRSFDTIYSRYALQHTADLDPAFIEAARVLKQNGKFVFVVTHPLRQYFEKPTRDYFTQEICTSRILNKSLTVQEPSHTFAEYFSPIANLNFNLENVIEVADPASQTIPGAGKYPGILLVSYRRNDYFEGMYSDSNTVLQLRKQRNKKAGKPQHEWYG